MSVIVGLDIGTTKIACFVGVKNEHGKIEIVSMGSTPSYGVSRGRVSNIIKTVDSIKRAIEITKENAPDHEISINFVTVGIASHHIKSQQHQGMITRSNSDELISQADIDHLIEDMYRIAVNPGEEIIHVIPQEYFVDDMQETLDPVGSVGIKLKANFHVITGQIQEGKNIHRCVEDAGLKVKDLVLEPLASADAVLTEEEKEGGVVLVDIGGGTTDIAIFKDGVIRHTAVIPFGGNIVTDDIKEGCSLLAGQAETLKVKFGVAMATEVKDNDIVCIPNYHGRPAKEIYIKNLARIIQARMEEIMVSVQVEIQKSGYQKKLNAGIVLTGGGSQLKHLTQLCEYITGISTRIGFPNEHLANSKKFDLTSPKYATGIGLVLKGFSKMQEEELNNMRRTKNNVVEELKEEEVKAQETEKINKERAKVVHGHSKGLINGKFFNTVKQTFGGLFEDNDD